MSELSNKCETLRNKIRGIISKLEDKQNLETITFEQIKSDPDVLVKYITDVLGFCVEYDSKNILDFKFERLVQYHGMDRFSDETNF